MAEGPVTPLDGTSVRRARAVDWAAVVALNNAEVPKVGPLHHEDREWFLGAASVHVAERDGNLVGLLVLMANGSDYASPNYGWFAARYPAFAYVDRIVVRADAGGAGIGRHLYDHAVAWARAEAKLVLTAEVNVEPPNERSLAFHRAFGFVEVGRFHDPRYAALTVAMFALDV